MSDFLVILQRNRDVADPRMPTWNPSEPTIKVSADSVEIRQKGHFLSARCAPQRSDRLYVERVNGEYTGSFVLVFGWCYSVTGLAPCLTCDDLALILAQHRSGTWPLWLNRFSGQYCLLSLDHRSQTLWCTCDAWAQHGFCFGGDAGLVVASSHAGRIADLLRSQIDGLSYIAKIRGTPIPPGGTLFANVHRVTCGNSVKFDFANQEARVVRTYQVEKSQESVGFHESVDRYIDVITRACLRVAKLPRVAVDLTGGNDTRVSAAVIGSRGGKELASKLTFKVHQVLTHPDAVIAQRIASDMGWNLRRFDPGYDISNESADLLRRVAPLSDGNRFPSELAMGIMRQDADWSAFDYLWGSLGGELGRDFFWRQEFHRMGLMTKVNYGALLQHRLYASTAVDFQRVSDGRVTLANHDEYILSAYKFIGELNPTQKNVYKLDRIYLSKLMFSSTCWEYSAQRTTALPLLTSEVLDVVLSTPWVHRAGRRLVKSAIEKLHPSLARIPHNSGAPMMPLRPSTAWQYAVYGCKYPRDAYFRHFSRSKATSTAEAVSTLPKQWLAWATEANRGTALGNSGHLMQRATSGAPLSQEETQEIEMLALLRALKSHHPGFREELTFEGDGAHPLQVDSHL